jgi:hypothetical protein
LCGYASSSNFKLAARRSLTPTGPALCIHHQHEYERIDKEGKLVSDTVFGDAVKVGS